MDNHTDAVGVVGVVVLLLYIIGAILVNYNG